VLVLPQQALPFSPCQGGRELLVQPCLVVALPLGSYGFASLRIRGWTLMTRPTLSADVPDTLLLLREARPGKHHARPAIGAEVTLPHPGRPFLAMPSGVPNAITPGKIASSDTAKDAFARRMPVIQRQPWICWFSRSPGRRTDSAAITLERCLDLARNVRTFLREGLNSTFPCDAAVRLT